MFRIYWTNTWINDLRLSLPLRSIFLLFEERRKSGLLYSSPFFIVHVWRLNVTQDLCKELTEKGNEMGLWCESSCAVPLPWMWVGIIARWEWRMNKVVLSWKKTQHTEPRSTWPVDLLREISYFGFLVLLSFPPLNRIWILRMPSENWFLSPLFLMGKAPWFSPSLPSFSQNWLPHT